MTYPKIMSLQSSHYSLLSLLICLFICKVYVMEILLRLQMDTCKPSKFLYPWTQVCTNIKKKVKQTKLTLGLC